MARYALIIGIAEYTTGSFRSLESPVQNANAIADILDRYGDFNQVRRLPFRREAGQKDLGSVIRKPLPNETLVQALQQFLHDADGSDVLIYYSGHGFTKLDQLSQTPEGYLAPSDCQVELNAAGQITAEKNGISLFGLNTLINRHTFNSLVVILDCCDSGAFLESGMIRRDVTAFGYQRDYYLITACRSASKAYEGEEYSLLTAAVLKGLSPANASSESGRISGDRLFDVIGNELQNSRQEPIRMGWGRLITLVRYQQPSESIEPAAHSFNATNPYMGLKPFGQEQAAYFFGREQAVRALLDRLAENRFLAVIGPSGCGKSSLVKAGLLPELEGDRIPGSHDWQIEIITPGQYPLQVLTHTLERHHSNDKPVVLFVDQFEELFTLCPHEEEQRTFIKRLNEETNDPAKQTRIIVAMRGDFLDRCAKFQEAADLINSTAPTTYMVIPLTEAKLVGDLKETITCPADLHGVSFESGLVSQIVDDVVNQPGAMPLLQYALRQLWDHCIAPDRPSRQLTLQSYEAIDGVKGALQRWADQFYTNLSSTDQTFVQELISELVQIGDGGEVTRRRVSWERLRSIASQEQLGRIIDRLVYQRLLVTDEQTVEVAHEALLSESKLIQGWIEENREGIRLQQRLEIYRREWQEHDRSENYLLDAGRLAAIDEWIEKKQPRLMSVDQAFIEQSRERRDRQFQDQLEQERRLREEAEGRAIAEIEKKIEAEARAEAEIARAKESESRVKTEKQKTQIAVLSGISLALLSIIAGVATILAQREKQNAQASEIRALTATSEALFNNHNQLDALVAAVKTLRQIKEKEMPVPPVLQKIISETQEYNRLDGHTLDTIDADFSVDGKIIGSTSIDRTVKLWKRDGKLIKTLTSFDAGVWGIAFSPNSQSIATGSIDGKIRLFDINGNLKREFKPQNTKNSNYEVLKVRFSPDNSMLVSAYRDGGVRIWRVIDGKLLKTFWHSDRVYGVDFSPKNDLVVSGSWDKSVKVWRVSDGKLLREFRHKNRIHEVTFSPFNDIIASASWDGTVKIWNISNGKLINRLAHPSSVYGISFSPDGEKIVSGATDRIVRLWDVKSGKLIEKFEGHAGPINSVNFSSDGKFIISTSDDWSVRIWSLASISISSSETDNLLQSACSWLHDYMRNNVRISDLNHRECDANYAVRQQGDRR